MKRNSTLIEDLDKIADFMHKTGEFDNTTFLVTGATGLIGSLVIKALLHCNVIYNANIKVIAVLRNIEKASHIFGFLINDKMLECRICDLSNEKLVVEKSIDYVIHAASVTNSKIMITNPVHTIETAIYGTENILKLAAQKQVKSVVYLSSMEVYGNPYFIDHKLNESELGYIDLTSVRSCYPEGKRMCECLCNAYQAQYKVNVKSARLAQTFGPGVLMSDKRVFAQFARSVIKGENIVLNTEGDSEGNYVYSRDAVIGILLLLIKGNPGEAYNIVNEESHITIRDMADMVANKVASNKINVVIDIPESAGMLGYAPKVKMSLDSKKMQNLGWKPEIGLYESYCRMIEYLSNEEDIY